MIEFVSATRMTEKEFGESSALGRSLARLGEAEAGRWVTEVAFENRRGLSEVFNERIQARSEHDILVFVHDDVWIDDFFISDHLEEALHEFAVVGVAGNRRRVPRQPAWAFTTLDFQWDERVNLCGGIAHAPTPFGTIARFGPTYVECELLDGVFVAARRSTLLEHGVLFDTRFKFHFYDLDFCRTARVKGLRLGCWPIALTHQSGGAFDSPSWREGYAAYLEKWKD
jgi:GT2 family glycosyltransferase